MVVKYPFYSLICILLFFSCGKNNYPKEENTEYNQETDLLKKLVKEVFNKDYKVDTILKKYFLEPNEILNDMEFEHRLIYKSRLNFYNRYQSTGISPLYLFWDEEILNIKDYHWILDRKLCHTTLLAQYYKYESTDSTIISSESFCACFKENKLYSIMPYGRAPGKVVWSRELMTSSEDGDTLVITEKK